MRIVSIPIASRRNNARGWALAVFLLARPIAADDTDSPIDIRGAKQGACAEGEISVGEVCVTPPKLLKKVEPVYPEQALREHLEGTVVMRAIVEKDGSVRELTVVSVSRHTAGFEEAAMTAVRQWKYEPPRIGNAPVRVAFDVKIRFFFK